VYYMTLHIRGIWHHFYTTWKLSFDIFKN